MKKLLGVSLIAILTAGMANAAPEYAAAVPVEPVAVTANTNVASTSYVQGAYNEAIKAVNKENQRALAAEGNLETLQTTNKASLVGAINELKGNINDIDTGVQSVTEGTTNGTISVDGSDVSVHGLGSAAFTDTTAYDAAGDAAAAEAAAKAYADGLAGNYATAAQGQTADAVNTLVGNTAMGTTATTVTGAIKELKDASDATNNKVLKVYTTWNSDAAQEIALTAPTVVNP